MMDSQAVAIPNGWVKKTLGEVVEILDSLRVPINSTERAGRIGNVPYYGATGQVGWIDDFLFDEELVLLGEDGAPFLDPNKPKAYLIQGKSWVNNHAHVLRGERGILNRFILYQLNTVDYRDFVSGTTRLKLAQAPMRLIPILVAPFAEQHRIVAEIEKQFTRLDAAVASLRRVQANLKRYRAAVLKAACEGRLVETEAALARAEQRPYEPAAELLQRILRERRARWEADQLAKMQAAGKPPKDDKWKAKYDEPAAPDTSALPELPEGWTWATVEQTASHQPRSIQSGPFGSSLLHSEFTDTGILAIGIDNVLEGRFSKGKENRISPEKFEELKKFAARPLDVLITVMATVGRCCVLPADIEPAIITKHCYRISPNLDFIKPHYLMVAFWGGEVVRGQIFGQIRGQTRPGINGQILKSVAVPIPPLAEQQRIVEEVERRLSIIDRLEKNLDDSLQRAETLRQKVLQDAFIGKLVQQDPQDEPASKLLERIKTERLKREAEERENRKEERKTVKKTGKTATGERRKLVEVLREAERPLAPDVLFREAGFKSDRPEEVEAFYDELKQADKDELIAEDKRPNGDVYLSARA